MTDDLAQQCAAAMWSRDTASQHLGVVITDVAHGRATATMTITDSMVNGHDIAHGGYVFTLADTAFAFACNTHGVVTVASGADVTFVAPAHKGDVLRAVAVERARFGRSGLCDVTVTRQSDGALIAEFRGRSRELGAPLLPS